MRNTLKDSASRLTPSSSARKYIGYFFEEHLLHSIKDQLARVNAHGFEIQSVESHRKEGGVFVTFSYTASETENQATLTDIINQLNEQASQKSGIPSWLPGFNRGKIWLVKGKPWKEVSNPHSPNDIYSYAP